MSRKIRHQNNESEGYEDLTKLAYALFYGRGELYIEFDATHRHVRVPKSLRGRTNVRLVFGVNLTIPISDLAVTHKGIGGTLSFSGRKSRVWVPWRAVFSLDKEGKVAVAWPRHDPERIAESKRVIEAVRKQEEAASSPPPPIKKSSYKPHRSPPPLPLEPLIVGDRVYWRKPPPGITGRTAWAVAECHCEACRKGVFVAVDEPGPPGYPEIPLRHLARGNLQKVGEFDRERAEEWAYMVTMLDGGMRKATDSNQASTKLLGSWLLGTALMDTGYEPPEK